MKSVLGGRLALTFFLSLVMTVFVAAQAVAETGRGVMDRTYEQADVFKQSEAEVKLTIVDEKGRKRVRYFNLRSKNNDDFKRSLVKFFRPANVKGTGLASETAKATQKKKQFVYFPSLKSVKQLSAAEQDNSFMGSDFSYSDIAGRTIDQDAHKLSQQNEKFYVVESIPVDSDDAYSKYYTTIDKSNNIVRSVTFYDRAGEKLKTLSNRKVIIIKGEPVVSLSVMTNHQTDGASTMKRSKFDVEVSFGNNDVGLKGLKAN